ncbi:DMT family transporter [Paenarthrobacter sp. 2TAF44]|uniref:DMT family transporter n=1 Tax=Paenarthrobacter sp. 2TAF44 TaxID=3233018 RepID=UPI003F9B1F5B
MMWPLLILAIAAEVAATTLLPKTKEFRRLKPTLVVACLYTIAFALLAQILRFTDMGIAYALWAGLGTAAIAAVGIIFRGEQASWKHGLGMVLVVSGIVALNLQSH